MSLFASWEYIEGIWYRELKGVWQSINTEDGNRAHDGDVDLGKFDSLLDALIAFELGVCQVPSPNAICKITNTRA
jgi:hypothetical protein